MRFLGFAVFAAIGCGGSVAASPPDGSVPGDGSVDSRDSALPDAAWPDVGTTSCTSPNPLDPPIGCGPAAEGAERCSSTTNVATCPTGNACMAPVKQAAPILNHRVGHLRLRAPDAILALTPIMIDPNVNPRCVNAGSEGLSWLLQIDQNAKSLRTGPARASTDGATFSFLDDTLSGTDLSAVCPGFVGPSEPFALRAVTTAVSFAGGGVGTPVIPELNLTIFDRSSGVPIVLPLREARIKIPSLAEPTCIGTWDRNYWCDGNTLGWTDGGALVAKISVEDADRVPIKAAGCQSLCAILVNDASKLDGKSCKRGPDGKVPPIGNACIGGEGCNNAWLFSASFSSYGVNITP